MPMHQRHPRSVGLAVAAAAAALLSFGSSASAGIWTPVDSGTSEDITAIDYRGPGQLRYTTASGKIFANGAQQEDLGGVSFNDIASNPSGTVFLAVGGNGASSTIRRSTGGPWSPPTTMPSSINEGCAFGAGTAITGPLTAVAWASDSVAYAVGAQEGVVFKTLNAGVTWTEVSRKSGGVCWAGDNQTLSDVATVVGTSLVTFVDQNFGARWVSSNGLTSSAVMQGASSVNCPGTRSRIAIDPDNPSRNHVVGACNGSLSFGFSEDGGTSYDLSMRYLAGDGDTLTGLYDVSTAGGSTIAVGNAGAILVSPNGTDAYFQRADGIDATNDWRAVDKADATNAAIGGRGGRLLVSTTANAVPDVVPPAGTVSGPTTAAAGTPVTYTADVSDNVGGSGIDPAGFSWSATGVPALTGNPVSVTFPSAGYYTLRVNFRDLAGNTETASIGVLVSSRSGGSGPGTGSGVIAPGTRTAKPTQTTSLPGGGSATLAGPKTCVRPGTSFTATLKWAKSKKKGSKLVKVTRADFYIDKKRVKIDKKAPFKQKLTVKNLKPGTTHTLRARAFIKVRKGKKSPTKSLKVNFAVCSS